MKRTLFFIVLLISNVMFSQVENSTKSFSVTDEVKILDEQLFYRNYFSEYKLSKNLFFRTGIEERSNSNLISSYTLMEFPLLFKYSLNNKLNVLFGPKVDVLKVDSGIGGVSLFSTFGLQYDFTEDFSVNAKVNYNLINGDATSTDYLGSDFVIYKIGTKLKF